MSRNMLRAVQATVAFVTPAEGISPRQGEGITAIGGRRTERLSRLGFFDVSHSGVLQRLHVFPVRGVGVSVQSNSWATNGEVGRG